MDSSTCNMTTVTAIEKHVVTMLPHGDDVCHSVASKNGGDPQKPPGLTGIHRGPIGDPGRPFHRRNGVVGEEVHALRGAQCGQEPGPECLVSVTCQAAALL